MSRINMIVAMTDNRVIGKGNDMPWHIPSDLKNFKRLTEGSCVIMGRKCWDSIPEKFRPLPKRVNIVVTRNEKFDAPGAATLSNIDKLVTGLRDNGENDEVFIIGGGEIYKQSFKYTERLFLTRILTNIEGDVLLEGFDESEWDLVSTSETLEENGFKFIFEEYSKKVKETLATDKN